MFQQIICIFEKELRYALRDTDVLIYSLLVPLIIYPLFIFAAGEVLMWQLSSAQQKFVVGTSEDNLHALPGYFASALQNSKEFKLSLVKDALAEVKRGKLDAALVSKTDADHNRFDCYTATKRGFMVAQKVESVLVEAQSKARLTALKEHKVPLDALNVYTMTETRLVPTAPRAGEVEKHSPLIAVVAVILGLLQSGLVAGVTSVCMFAEEKEKKTYETTLSLPVPSFVLTTGKWLAACAITVVSTVLYVIAITGSFLVVAMQLLSFQKQEVGLIGKSLQMEPLSYVMTVLAVLLGAGIGCALCMLCVSACKRFKDAQVMAMYPMFVILALPALAVVPGIEQSAWAGFVPLTNILLTLKHPQSGWIPIAICLSESVVFIWVCLWLAGKIFFSEKSMFGSGAGAATLNQRQQAESV